MQNNSLWGYFLGGLGNYFTYFWGPGRAQYSKEASEGRSMQTAFHEAYLRALNGSSCRVVESFSFF